jgi:hypothetical protein
MDVNKEECARCGGNKVVSLFSLIDTRRGMGNLEKQLRVRRRRTRAPMNDK